MADFLILQELTFLLHLKPQVLYVCECSDVLENEDAKNYSRINFFPLRIKVSKCVFVIDKWILTHWIQMLYCHHVAQNMGIRPL